MTYTVRAYIEGTGEELFDGRGFEVLPEKGDRVVVDGDYMLVTDVAPVHRNQPFTSQYDYEKTYDVYAEVL